MTVPDGVVLYVLLGLTAVNQVLESFSFQFGHISGKYLEICDLSICEVMTSDHTPAWAERWKSKSAGSCSWKRT